jgi:hypothetical protein
MRHRILIAPAELWNPGESIDEAEWTVLADFDDMVPDVFGQWRVGKTVDLTAYRYTSPWLAFEYLGQTSNAWFIDDFCVNQGKNTDWQHTRIRVQTYTGSYDCTWMQP